MIATSRERPLTVSACNSIADESTVPLTLTFWSFSCPRLWLVMPVLDGPTPLRCALKSNRSQSPRTAAGCAAGVGLELVAPVAVVVAAGVVGGEAEAPCAGPPQATSTTAHAADSPRAINEAFMGPRLARGDGQRPGWCLDGQLRPRRHERAGGRPDGLGGLRGSGPQWPRQAARSGCGGVRDARDQSWPRGGVMRRRWI